MAGRMIRRLLVAALLLAPVPTMAEDTPPPAAQVQPPAAEDAAQSAQDRDWLTGMIEDKLSGDGRQIRVDGFRGAFSSKATFDQLTVSDANGPWLTIRGGTMSWSRAALLTGKVEISELTATEIDIDRRPETPASAVAPAPEAKPFRLLPDLPVSVNIGKLSVGKLALGAPVLGEAVTLTLDGNLSLSGTDAKAKLAMTRLDGTKGSFSFTGGYSEGKRQLSVDLLVDEGQGGLVSKLAKLPGSPALTLAVAGSGPLDAFSSDVVLSTDSQPRVTGKVTLSAAAPAADGTRGQGFAVNLAGDLTPLLPDEYRDFFGTQSKLSATGVSMPDGSFSLSDLTVASQALNVQGRLATLPSGMPDSFSLNVALGSEDTAAAPVLLPVSGPETRVQSANLRLFYDRSRGQGWTLSGVLNGLSRADLALGQVKLAGNGLVSLAEQTDAASGRINFNVTGLAPADPALAEAVGPTLDGSTVFDWTSTHPLNLTNLVLNGRDLALTGAVSIGNLAEGIDIMPDLVLDARDLRHYAALTGRPLAGAIEGTVKGKLTALSGAFDLDASLSGQDLKTGIAESDALLSGRSQIEVSAARDETGLTIRQFSANAHTLSVTAAGVLATGSSDLTAEVALRDLGSLGGRYRGSADLKASILDVDGERRYTLDGTATNLAFGQETADRLLAGNTVVTARAATRDGVTRLTALNLQNPQLSAKAEGTSATAVRLSARLANIGLITPKYSGPVTVEGTLGQQGSNYALDLKAGGPGGLQAVVAGTVAGNLATTDLTIRGKADTALANNFIDPQSVEGTVSFDLKMQGKPGLNALSGRIEAPNASLNVPAASLALQNIRLVATLGGGKVTLDTRAAIKGGGSLTLSGPVTLTAPFQSNLKLVLSQARLRDPELYDTRISGTLGIAGPLAGGAAITGRLSLGTTEIRVPSSLGGTAEIPDISHRGAPVKVTRTLSRAGLLHSGGEGSRGAAVSYRLDVTIDAPNQVYVRGRGLDAELGGSLRLTGTTANIVPVGHFTLVRGRLDVLAKRFTLTDGQVAMQGTLTPWLLFVATANQEDTTITIQLEGEATQPKLTLTSSPELPEDEILARLLFNKGLTNLSALQAAQLASAVATLAGKGGDGIIAKLRKNFGMDDLDVGTDDNGNTSLRAGRYLSKKVYSDVAVDSLGQTELNLNLDINSHVTARGTVGSGGDSSVGLFFQKDY